MKTVLIVITSGFLATSLYAAGQSAEPSASQLQQESGQHVGVVLDQDTLTWFFGIATITGTILTIWAILSARARRRQQDHIYRIAALHMEQEATEESLRDRKDRLAEASRELAAVKSTIERELPKEARRAVLRNRLEVELAQLVTTHDSLQRVRSELSSLGDPAELPAAVLAAVQDELRPEYVNRNRISHLKTLLTIITAVGAILTGLVPGHLDRLVLVAMIVAIAPVLVLLADAMLPAARQIRRVYQQIALLVALVVGAIASISFGALLLAVEFSDPVGGGTLAIGVGFVAFGTLAAAAAVVVWTRNRIAFASLLGRRRRGEN